MRHRDWRQRMCGLGFLFLVSLSLGCQPRAESQGEHGLLVVHSENGYFNLIDLQGHETEIAQSLGVYGLRSHAAWSPSGKNVAYLCRVGEDYPWLLCDVEIARMALQKYPLPRDGNLDLFTWSADERNVLLLWNKELWRLERATGQLALLSQLPDDSDVEQGYESWSPDGSRIAFITRPRDRTGTENPWWKDQDLYVQNLDGTARKLIYRGVGRDPIWSPDGSRIAFWRDSICWVAVEGGGATCTTENAGDSTWSPDGRSIAFFSRDGITMVDTRTEQVRTVFHISGQGNPYELTWSPDGRYLAYTVCCCLKPNNSCEIHVVTSDGAKHWQVTDNQRPDEYPAWRPIGTADGVTP